MFKLSDLYKIVSIDYRIKGILIKDEVCVLSYVTTDIEDRIEDIVKDIEDFCSSKEKKDALSLESINIFTSKGESLSLSNVSIENISYEYKTTKEIENILNEFSLFVTIQDYILIKKNVEILTKREEVDRLERHIYSSFSKEVKDFSSKLKEVSQSIDKEDFIENIK